MLIRLGTDQICTLVLLDGSGLNTIAHFVK